MNKEKYIEKLLQRIDEILMEEAIVRSKLRNAISELRKTIKIIYESTRNKRSKKTWAFTR